MGGLWSGVVFVEVACVAAVVVLVFGCCPLCLLVLLSVVVCGCVLFLLLSFLTCELCEIVLCEIYSFRID